MRRHGDGGVVTMQQIAVWPGLRTSARPRNAVLPLVARRPQSCFVGAADARIGGAALR